ncbi:hypothetical protein [Actinoplanes sp. NPDC051851]|uniref:hypothetical protein n=1 Tax=Actinoplanes sp. NPDC051851 TaxID=3154753 RepID=UPI00342F11E9
MIEASERSFPGRLFRIETEPPDGTEFGMPAARTALSATFSLIRGLCTPLSAELSLCCRNTETGFPTATAPKYRFRGLGASRIPPGMTIQPSWEDEEFDSTTEITEESIISWIDGLLSQECAPNEHTDWTEITFRNTSVRIPAEWSGDLGDTLTLFYNRGSTQYPVDHDDLGCSIAGPRGPVLESPIELSVTNDLGILSISLYARWSLWADEGSAGYQLISDATARVAEADGWTITDP